MTDEDKKDFEEINKESEEASVSEGENKPEEVTQNQSEVENTTNPTEKSENADETSNIDNQNQNLEDNANQNDSSDEEKQEKNTVIHKKDGRLHIYVRQDKYKGELKSKNWVGRLYIDGKQKISSSGTQNLDEAIPILEKWFDDVQAESEKQKKQAEEQQNIPAPVIEEPSTPPEETKPSTEIPTPSPSTPTNENIVNQNLQNDQNKIINDGNDNAEDPKPKSKISNIFGKLKNIKLKKPSLDGIKLPASSKKSSSNSITKFIDKLKSKIGKSSIQGEEIIGVELNNKEIRLAQVNLNKSNQWVLEKFFTQKVEIADESSVIENADKFTEELSLALQKIKLDTNNVAISIPVTSAIIRVVTAPLMKDEELQKAIDTNSLWENLVQLTDNLDDYSIFHQVINRNEKDNTMDILFVASKLTDINSYVSIVKNSGLNPVIIDVKCFALKSAVDQINQITKKAEDTNLTAVLEFGLDENYLMILYDNNPIITDIFLRGQDRKILLESQVIEEKEGLVRRYAVQVKQAIQDFETKYEKRIRNIKVVSDVDNVEEYLSYFRKSLMNVGFNLFDPVSGLQVPQQFDKELNKENRSYLTTSIGLAFRKLDVFGYYKFVTAVKNINLLPNRDNMIAQKKAKAFSNFAFKGVVGVVAVIYVILFGLSFWQIVDLNKKIQGYEQVVQVHQERTELRDKFLKEKRMMDKSLQLSNSIKSNKTVSFRVLAQIASAVPNRVKLSSIEYNGSDLITIQGTAFSDQDILKLISNLNNKKLIAQASLASMILPEQKDTQSRKGFVIACVLEAV